MGRLGPTPPVWHIRTLPILNSDNMMVYIEWLHGRATKHQNNDKEVADTSQSQSEAKPPCQASSRDGSTSPQDRMNSVTPSTGLSSNEKSIEGS